MKRKILILCATMLMILGTGITASAGMYGVLTYEMDQNKITITDCNSLATEVVIPRTIDGWPVIGIGNAAFSGCTSLTSITIPNSIRRIGDGAFYGCASLTSITIPENVTNIGYRAFYFCSSLTNITVDENNENYSSEDGVLFNKNKTNLIHCPGGKTGCYIIPNSVTSIGDNAFYYCERLTNIAIPTSVIDIGGQAFYFCSGLTSITIPENVKTVGNSAFYGTAYYNDSSNWENDVLYIGEYLIKADSPLSGNYEVKTGTRCIGENAFANHSNLTGVIIPDSVAIIDNYAFEGCGNLTSITMGDNVEIIGSSAFDDCKSLKSITIPNSVTSIGSAAFKGCSSLESITIGDSVTVIGGLAFYECASLKNISIPNSVTIIDSYAFRYCRGLTDVKIGDNVTIIDDSAFQGCTRLTRITIPDSVTEIGYSTFSSCTALKTVYYTGTEAQWDTISVGSYNEDLTDATIVYNYTDEIATEVSDALTKYISDDNKATGFSATITNGKYTTEAIESVIWTITPAGGEGVEIPTDLPTTLTLDYEASAVIGVVLDGLYDKNATAELEI